MVVGGGVGGGERHGAWVQPGVGGPTHSPTKPTFLFWNRQMCKGDSPSTSVLVINTQSALETAPENSARCLSKTLKKDLDFVAIEGGKGGGVPIKRRARPC
jgi:hypothetical protein